MIASLVTIAASWSFAEGRMYCYHPNYMRSEATGGGKVNVDGFTVEVTPVPDLDDPDSMTCQATIRSPEGKTIFEQDEWGMEIDPVTGKDINGDGHPDVVIVSYSGGAHCCWTYYFVSLAKNPGVVGQFENRSTASFADLNKDGRIEILIRDGTFDFAFGSHVESPFPLLIVRLNETKFVDVSSAFRGVYDKGIQEERSKLKEGYVRKLLNSNPDEGLPDDDSEDLSTRYRVLTVVLEYLYSGRPGKAREALGELWPMKSREQTWEKMVDGYCSGLRAELKLDASAVCKGR